MKKLILMIVLFNYSNHIIGTKSLEIFLTQKIIESYIDFERLVTIKTENLNFIF
jgi:hypothetical protein